MNQCIITREEIKAIAYDGISTRGLQAKKDALIAVRSHPYNPQSEYIAAFDEGFEIGKAQCETHYEEIRQAERDKTLEQLDDVTKLEDFLEWVADRLQCVHCDSPKTDFILSLRKRAQSARKLRTPHPTGRQPVIP